MKHNNTKLKYKSMNRQQKYEDQEQDLPLDLQLVVASNLSI